MNELKTLAKPFGSMKKMSILKSFTGAGVFLLFALFLAQTNISQILSLLVYPFSKDLFRKINKKIVDICWHQVVATLNIIHKTQFIITGDPLISQENAIVISNHQGMSDIIVLGAVAGEKNMGGCVKFMAKDVLKYLPGIGLGMKFLGCLFLKRNWSQDKNTIEAAFSQIIQNRIPVWLAIFAEGTRITPKKLKFSQNYANKQNIAIPRHVLIPRTKGLAASVFGLRNHVEAVYDVTIAYPGKIPSFWDFIRGEPSQVYVYTRRFPFSEIPQDEKKLNEWTLQLFYEKDCLLSYFHQHHAFPKELPPFSPYTLSTSNTSR